MKTRKGEEEEEEFLKKENKINFSSIFFCQVDICKKGGANLHHKYPPIHIPPNKGKTVVVWVLYYYCEVKVVIYLKRQIHLLKF